MGSWHDVDRPGAGERPTECEPGDDERVLTGRQAAQHAKVANSDEGRRSGPRPKRVAGLRNDIELIAEGQETVAEDVLRRAAVDADREFAHLLADDGQGARTLLGRRLSEERRLLGVRARGAGQRDEHLHARHYRTGGSGPGKQDLA